MKKEKRSSRCARASSAIVIARMNAVLCSPVTQCQGTHLSERKGQLDEPLKRLLAGSAKDYLRRVADRRGNIAASARKVLRPPIPPRAFSTSVPKHGLESDTFFPSSVAFGDAGSVEKSASTERRALSEDTTWEFVRSYSILYNGDSSALPS